MIIIDDIIHRKNIAVEKFARRSLTDIASDIVKLFGDVRDIKMMQRPWHPGGGAALFTAVIGNEEVFIKIKDKTLGVENRLEQEQVPPTKGSLDNEAMFCGLLADEPQVPKLKAYKEDQEYAYAVFERLVSFEEGIKALDAYERYEAFKQISDLLRRLYSKGIVHSDVHEKNILFRGKQPVLCDFEEARLLVQDVPFEQSLDVIGQNKYGALGEFPHGYGLPGLACLQRLRLVFKKAIKDVLPALLEKCHFSNDCAFNVDELQGKDERIYQSIDLGDSVYAGQRPLQDPRQDILLRLLEALGGQLGKNLHVVDIGSNLGAMSFTAARSPFVRKVTGLEAFPEYVQVARILSFLRDQDQVGFQVNQAGVDALPDEPIDVLFLFSVYHHVRNKDAFLQEMARHRPRVIITEFAIQDRYYDQRKTAENELHHIGNLLGYSALQVIGHTADYGRPLCVFSNLQPFPQNVLDTIMGKSVASPAAPAKTATSYPVKVSIVLPTYNHAQFLQPAIQSILSQTYDNFELIIVNDGSTDQTAQLLANLQHPKVRVVTQNNQGLPAALNSGFAVARGEYWTWTSADNLVAPIWLAELVAALDNSPPDVGYALSHYALINDQGQIINVDADQRFETWSMLIRNGNASFLYRSDLARQVGVYDTSLNGAEDLDMWIRMSQVTRAVLVESVLYYYRLHANSMTSMIPDKVQKATVRMVEKFIASCGGKLEVERIFPAIAESANPALARWQAKVWLAGRLSVSPFCPTGALVDLLIAALLEKYEPSLVGNIVHLFADKGAWAPAADVVDLCMKKDPSPFMSQLADIVARKDMDALKKIPFVSLADEALVFDRRGQLSRAKMAV